MRSLPGIVQEDIIIKYRKYKKDNRDAYSSKLNTYVRGLTSLYTVLFPSTVVLMVYSEEHIAKYSITYYLFALAILCFLIFPLAVVCCYIAELREAIPRGTKPKYAWPVQYPVEGVDALTERNRFAQVAFCSIFIGTSMFLLNLLNYINSVIG